MMKFFVRLSTSLILGVLIFHFSGVNAQSSAPFLYYYNQAQGAFIIERADGSDSRILANFEISPSQPDQEVHPIIVGPGWPPSGQWFAWRESTNYGGVSSAHIVNKDGHAITILDDAYVAVMKWSPTDDKLLVTRRASGEQPFWYDVYIIDPQNPDHPVQIRDSLQYNVPSYDYTDWTPDGRYVVQYSMDKLGDSKMEMATVDGTITTRDFYRSEIDCGIPAWSSDSKVAYVTADRKAFILENTVTGEVSQLQPPTGNIQRMVWSPDGRNILSFASTDCSKFAEDLDMWLASTQGITLIAEHVKLPFSSTLPYQFLNLGEWSQDSHYAYFTSADELFVLDAFTKSIVSNVSQKKGDIISIAWLSDNQLAFIQTAQYNLDALDPDSQKIAPLLPENTFLVQKFTLSPDAGYIAYSGQGFHIANLQTQQTVDVDVSRGIPGEINYGDNGYIREIRWHPSEDWVIVETGDHFGPVYVSNADGSIQRTLTVCASNPSCFGWLPES